MFGIYLPCLGCAMINILEITQHLKLSEDSMLMHLFPICFPNLVNIHSRHLRHRWQQGYGKGVSYEPPWLSIKYGRCTTPIFKKVVDLQGIYTHIHNGIQLH